MSERSPPHGESCLQFEQISRPPFPLQAGQLRVRFLGSRPDPLQVWQSPEYSVCGDRADISGLLFWHFVARDFDLEQSITDRHIPSIRQGKRGLIAGLAACFSPARLVAAGHPVPLNPETPHFWLAGH